MPWHEAAWDHATLDAVRAALALRREHELLRRGDEELRALDDDAVLVRRSRLGEAIDIVIHRGTSTRSNLATLEVHRWTFIVDERGGVDARCHAAARCR